MPWWISDYVQVSNPLGWSRKWDVRAKTNVTVACGGNSMSPFQVSNQLMSKTQSLWQQNLLSPATWQPSLSFVELLSKFPESPDTSVLKWNANAFLCAVKWAAVKSQAVHSDPLQPMAFSLLTTQQPPTNTAVRYPLTSTGTLEQVKVMCDNDKASFF